MYGSDLDNNLFPERLKFAVDQCIPLNKLSDNYYSSHLQSLDSTNKKRINELDNVTVDTPSVKKRSKAVARNFITDDDDGEEEVSTR